MSKSIERFVDIPRGVESALRVRVKRVELDRPWLWLGRGWNDFVRMPFTSLGYGAIFVLAGMSLAAVVWVTDLLYLLLPMMAGFMLLGPLVALGLYSVSRGLERESIQDGSATLFRSFVAWRSNPHQVGFMGLVLVLICLIWLRVAAVLFALFFVEAPPSLQELLVQTVFETNGFLFLVTGTLVGAVLAAVVFSVGVISFPMLLDRDVSFVTAVVTSVVTIRTNLPVMLFWAALIVGFTGAGFVTGMLGLAVVLPLIGYASWHAYRDMIAVEG